MGAMRPPALCRAIGPFEILAEPVQLQMLEVAATAIRLIESKILKVGRELAGLLPEPQGEFPAMPSCRR